MEIMSVLDEKDPFELQLLEVYREAGRPRYAPEVSYNEDGKLYVRIFIALRTQWSGQLRFLGLTRRAA